MVLLDLMPTQRFPGRFESLVEISEFVARAAKEAGLDSKQVYAVRLAVDEACSNIIEHGYGDEEHGEIECAYQITDDGVSPLMAAFISILPFFLAVYSNISIFVAIALSIVIIMCMLFSLGAFLSKVAGGRIIFNGAIMVLAGIVTLFLCFFLIF